MRVDGDISRQRISVNQRPKSIDVSCWADQSFNNKIKEKERKGKSLARALYYSNHHSRKKALSIVVLASCHQIPVSGQNTIETLIREKWLDKDTTVEGDFNVVSIININH